MQFQLGAPINLPLAYLTSAAAYMREYRWGSTILFWVLQQSLTNLVHTKHPISQNISKINLQALLNRIKMWRQNQIWILVPVRGFCLEISGISKIKNDRHRLGAMNWHIFSLDFGLYWWFFTFFLAQHYTAPQMLNASTWRKSQRQGFIILRNNQRNPDTELNELKTSNTTETSLCQIISPDPEFYERSHSIHNCSN